MIRLNKRTSAAFAPLFTYEAAAKCGKTEWESVCKVLKMPEPIKSRLTKLPGILYRSSVAVGRPLVEAGAAVDNTSRFDC